MCGGNQSTHGAAVKIKAPDPWLLQRIALPTWHRHRGTRTCSKCSCQLLVRTAEPLAYTRRAPNPSRRNRRPQTTSQRRGPIGGINTRYRSTQAVLPQHQVTLIAREELAPFHLGSHAANDNSKR
jgi:hypothetical protein